MDKPLQERIEERKQQAQERRIAEKIRAIVSVFSDCSNHSVEGMYFRNADFRICCQSFFQQRRYHPLDDYFKTDYITYRGETVFSCETKFDADANDVIHIIDSYVPGDWEQKFEKLYQKSQAKIDKDRAIRAAQDGACERARWGL